MDTEGTYQIRVDGFEGPMGLLLHLIKKNHLNIYDIPIALITHQYLETLDQMQVLNLSVAGEFLVMAATLIHIKSKMLLPPQEVEEEMDEVDPRSELVYRLLEYKKFKEAAQYLERQESLWRHCYRRTQKEAAPQEIILVDMSLYAFLNAWQSVLDRSPEKKMLHIAMETLSVKDRIQFLIDKMNQVETLYFHHVTGERDKKHLVVVTFLAMLELVKLGMIKIIQIEPFGALLLVKTENLSFLA